MISELHEILVDEIRFSFGRFMQQYAYELRQDVAFAAESNCCKCSYRSGRDWLDSRWMHNALTRATRALSVN